MTSLLPDLEKWNSNWNWNWNNGERRGWKIGKQGKDLLVSQSYTGFTNMQKSNVLLHVYFKVFRVFGFRVSSFEIHNDWVIG